MAKVDKNSIGVFESNEELAMMVLMIMRLQACYPTSTGYSVLMRRIEAAAMIDASMVDFGLTTQLTLD